MPSRCLKIPLSTLDGAGGSHRAWQLQQILACTPDETINALVPHRADDNIVRRERATAALGYMGPAAAPAQVSSEREKRLMEWCLREIRRAQ
jgi:hypothetical protein